MSTILLSITFSISSLVVSSQATPIYTFNQTHRSTSIYYDLHRNDSVRVMDSGASDTIWNRPDLTARIREQKHIKIGAILLDNHQR